MNMYKKWSNPEKGPCFLFIYNNLSQLNTSVIPRKTVL